MKRKEPDISLAPSYRSRVSSDEAFLAIAAVSGSEMIFVYNVQILADTYTIHKICIIFCIKWQIDILLLGGVK